MGDGDESGSEVAEIRPLVSDLESTAREVRVHVQEEVVRTGSAAEAVQRDEVRALRQELAETRRELRRLEQYVAALEERVDG